MNYLRLSLVALLFVTKTIASEESSIVLAQKQLDGLFLEVTVEMREGAPIIPSLVCKLTNKGTEDIVYGHGTRALGFVLSATALDGKRAEYSPRARTLFDPIAYISYGHVPIKAGGSIEYAVPIRDIQGLFLTPIKMLRIEWSRGSDPTGTDYPKLSGALVDLDMVPIVEAARRLGEANQSPAPLSTTSEPAPAPVASLYLGSSSAPIQSPLKASIQTPQVEPSLARSENPFWWIIGAITALAAVALVLCRKKAIR